MTFQLDSNWQLQPIVSDTGNTFIGINGTEKVFIKRNSSPFLAALSQEGITPKLVWTRRSSSGDVFTAQEWLEGKVLEAREIGRRLDVIQILHHVHHSESLKGMLRRVGGEEASPIDLLRQYSQELPMDLQNNHYLSGIFRFLEDHLPDFFPEDYCACHGDVTHHNWMESKEGRLYLVDWDTPVLADPMRDVAVLLGRYVAMSNWEIWLEAYGLRMNPKLEHKIKWYSGIDYLLRIRQAYQKHQYQEMNAEIFLLKKVFSYENGHLAIQE